MPEKLGTVQMQWSDRYNKGKKRHIQRPKLNAKKTNWFTKQGTPEDDGWWEQKKWYLKLILKLLNINDPKLCECLMRDR